MRYGVLADIHANLHALSAALVALRREEIDRFLVLGDLVGYGSRPNECIAEVAALDATCISGNHDLMALGKLSDANCIELARRSLRWTRSELSEESRRFLDELQPRAVLPDGIVLAHGSLDDPRVYVVSAADARRELARMAVLAPDASVLLLGHTHRALAADRDALIAPRLARLTGGPLLLNPGAVGQSRELRARARALILDTNEGTVEFVATPYDVSACRRDLRRARLSSRSHHLRPSPARRGVRLVRRVGRAVNVG